MADEDKTGTEGAAGTEQASQEQQIDWEAEAAKWKEMARKHEGRAKTNADAAKRLQEIEDSQKSEAEKAAAAAKAAEDRATAAELKALRFEVAADKAIPAKLMKFLTGSTKEELEESAAELLEAVKPDTGDSKTQGTGKPKEALRAGTAPTAEPEKSVKDILEGIPRG